MSTALYWISATFVFLAELGALAAVGYWGFHLPGPTWLRWTVGLGGPALMAVLWGVFGSPDPAVALPGPGTMLFRVVFFAVAALALWAADRPVWGVALFAVWALAYAVTHLLVPAGR